MAKFTLQPEERLLKHGTMGHLRGRLSLVPGEGRLTDQRFVHTSTMRALAAGGLLGILSSGKVGLDVPLTSISGLARDYHGRNESVLAITTKNGQTHRLLAPFDEWLAAFRTALWNHRSVGMVEYGVDVWHVGRG